MTTTTKRKGDKQIKKIWYDGFSIEKVAFGGRYSQKEIKSALTKAGIRWTINDAYTIYMGHWAIYIESKYAEEVSEWLWGSLWELPNHGQEKE